MDLIAPNLYLFSNGMNYLLFDYADGNKDKINYSRNSRLSPGGFHCTCL